MAKIKTDSSVSWNAFWIQSKIYGGPRTTAPCPYMRKAFSLEKPVTSATLHITALGLYEAEINGHKVGNDELTPGYTEFRQRLHFYSYDVRELLKPGANVLGAILGDGWYSGHICWMNRQYYGARPKLLAQLDIVCSDGSTTQIISDNSWKATTGPILESDLLMGESYDANREIPDWSRPACDDSLWDSVELATPEVDPVLSYSPAPPVRRIEEISAVSVKDLGINKYPKSKRLYDLGQNFSGRAQIHVKAAPGRVLIIRHAEILEKPHLIHTANLRTARATDVYVCKSDQWETWEPRFTFHGFRYVEIQGFAEEDACEVKGVVLHNDMADTGKLTCSNPLLNQLISNIRWGQKSNFLEIPTDCPQRDERMGWTGDAQVFAETATFFMDVHSFFQKWLRDLRDTQGTEGDVPAFVPMVKGDYRTGLPGDGGPAWGDAVFICPWSIYRTYGDLEMLRLNYPAMKAYHTYLTRNKVKDDIRSHPDVDSWGGFGDWLALDGGGSAVSATPKDLIGTAFYAYGAEIMARTAALLGLNEESQAHWKRHAEIVQAFRNRFCSPDGLMASGTQTSYVLALHFNLLPESARPTAAAQLVAKIKANKNHLATGFVGTPYLLDVLEDNGYLDVAYKLLEQETFPSWLFSVKQGATTIWERWDSWTIEKGFHPSGMNSFNHYAFGAVAAWMVRSMAGLSMEPHTAAYEKILFRPRPGGTLTSAEAALKTVRGLAKIAWQLVGDELIVETTIPDNSSARLDPPTGYVSEVPLQAGPGSHRWVLKPARA